MLRIPRATEYIEHIFAEGTLRNWICAGRLPVVKIGGSVFLSTDVLDELLAGRLPLQKGAESA